jgi:molybdate transport system substrate-binding protein
VLLIVAVVAVAALAVAVALVGRGDGAADGVDVLSAASLAEAAAEIDPRARVQAAGSDQLAFQIENGIRADVFLSADAAIARRLHDAGHLTRPVAVAGNRLVLIVPAGNPAAIAAPSDLARPGTRLVLGTPSVPVGGYARRALADLGLDAAIANVVSEEPDVRGVVAKVALGEADAGIVYSTDAAVAATRVDTIPIPDAAQPAITYAAGVLTASPTPDRGNAFIARMRSPGGRAILAAHGFTVPSP